MTNQSSAQIVAPARAVPQIQADWFTRFALQLRTTQAIRDYAGEVDLVLLGDSITECWQYSGIAAQVFAGLKVLNYGIGGDSTQHLLWRIENGLLDGLRPRVVSLMIGVNNLSDKAVVADVAAGVIACARAARERLPYARLVHFGILPTAAPRTELNPIIKQVNAKVAKVASDCNATWIDLAPDFCAKPGEVKPGLHSDGLHLLDAGYQIWADRLRPLTE
jgi:beta-glucosidase